MKIAILGSGNVGGALAAGWAKAGHEVVIAARNPDSDSARAAAEATGAVIKPIAEACKDAEVILLATPWLAVGDALKAVEDTTGKVLLDATNPLKPELKGLDVPKDSSGGEVVQSMAPNAKVVKIFNTIGAQHMRDAAGMTMFYCGDDDGAKAMAAQLAKDVGFEPVDAGPLSMSASLEHFAFLWINLAYKRGIGPNFGLGMISKK